MPARAIVRAATEQGLQPAEPDSFEAVPGRGVVARIDGEEVLVGTPALLAEHGVREDPDLLGWAERQRAAGRTVVLVARSR